MSRKTNNAVRLTDRIVDKLGCPPGKPYVLMWDEEVKGMAAKVTEKGGKSFVLQYRVTGRANVTRLRLCDASAGVAEGRKLARLAMSQVDRNEDPAAQRAAIKAARSTTIRDYIHDFEDQQRQRQVVSYERHLRMLRRLLQPWMGHSPEVLTRRVLVDILDDQSPGNYRTARRHMSGLLNMLANRGVIPANPLIGHSRPRKTRAEKIEEDDRRGSLNDDQLRVLWGAADQLGHPFGDVTKVAVLTGLRAGECARLHRDQLEDDWLMFSAAQNKMGNKGFAVFATPQLRRILDSVPLTTSGYFFPGRRTGEPILNKSFAVRGLRRFCPDLEFTFHDLRRTFRSGLSRLDVVTEVAEFCLNHQQGELLRIYNDHLPLPKMANAWQLWADHVSRVVGETTDD